MLRTLLVPDRKDHPCPVWLKYLKDTDPDGHLPAPASLTFQRQVMCTAYVQVGGKMMLI